MARLTQISFEDNQSAGDGIGVLVWRPSNGEVYGKKMFFHSEREKVAD